MSTNYFTIMILYLHLLPGIMYKDGITKIGVGKERLDNVLRES